jgi:hypothetical protein
MVDQGLSSRTLFQDLTNSSFAYRISVFPIEAISLYPISVESCVRESLMNTSRELVRIIGS